MVECDVVPETPCPDPVFVDEVVEVVVDCDVLLVTPSPDPASSLFVDEVVVDCVVDPGIPPPDPSLSLRASISFILALNFLVSVNNTF